MDFRKNAEIIQKAAKEIGASNNFIFSTTFERYIAQLDTLEKLQAEINAGGATVEKSYIKGTSNVYSNPAIKTFNQTVDSANKTALALLKIIKQLDSGTDDVDPLMELINGGGTL